MKILARWLSRRRPATPRRRAMPSEDTTAADTPPRGCAWYDSSLDLRRGLVVREVAARAQSLRS
jgi:hypothetical protein